MRVPMCLQTKLLNKRGTNNIVEAASICYEMTNLSLIWLCTLIETSYGAVHAQLQLIEWKEHDEQPNNDQVEIQWKINVLFLIYHGSNDCQHAVQYSKKIIPIPHQILVHKCSH
jgi:hypothetical protein